MPTFSPKYMLVFGQIFYCIWFLTKTTHTLNNQYRLDTSFLNAPLCLYVENNLKIYGVVEKDLKINVKLKVNN